MQRNFVIFSEKFNLFLEKLEAKTKNPDPFTAILFVSQALFLIFALLSFSHLTSKKVTVETNDPTISSISLENPKVLDYSGSHLGTIEKELFRIVEVNTENAKSFKNPTAKIRENAIYRHSFADQNIEYLSFIVDLPDLEQSYQVFHEWSTVNDNPNTLPNDSITILCLEKDQIYENFACKDIYDQKTRNALAFRYLSWHRFDSFAVSLIDPAKQKLEIPYPKPKEDRAADFLAELKSFISSLGLAEDRFTYSAVLAYDPAPDS